MLAYIQSKRERWWEKNNKKKTFSRRTGEIGGIRDWENGVPLEKVWLTPVLLIFDLKVAVSQSIDSIIQNISIVIKAAQTNYI